MSYTLLSGIDKTRHNTKCGCPLIIIDFRILKSMVLLIISLFGAVDNLLRIMLNNFILMADEKI